MHAPVIVCAADDRFALPLAVTLYSALAHLTEPDEALMCVLDAGISEAHKRRVERVVRHGASGATLQWLHPEPNALEGLSGNAHLPLVVCFRLLIPDLLPPGIEKAIYLDSDMLVLDDLRRLWNREVEGYSHLAVQDLGQPYVSSSWEAVPDYRALGLPPETPYFNSGLMVINLRRWRAEQFGERVAAYMRSHDPAELRFLDQGGLNAVLAEQWGKLNPQWNQMHGIYECDSWKDSPYGREAYRAAREHPYIIHYTYTGKPWRPDCRHPRTRLYLRYLKASGWFAPAEWFLWRAQYAMLTFAKRAVSDARQKAQLRTRARRGWQWLQQRGSAS